VNFGGNPANLGAAPHDRGFAKNCTTPVHRKLHNTCTQKFAPRLCTENRTTPVRETLRCACAPTFSAQCLCTKTLRQSQPFP